MSSKNAVVIDLVERMKDEFSKEQEEQINSQVDELLVRIFEDVSSFESAAKELHAQSFNYPAMRLERLIYALACFKDIAERI